MIYDRIGWRLAVLGTAFVWLQMAAAAQTSGASPQPFANDWQRVPMTLPREPLDSSSVKDLEDRGQYFDKIIGSSLPLDQPEAAGVGRAFSGTVMPEEEFPVDASDTIAIATFTSYTPHLSPSKRSIYTEIKLQVDMVIAPGPSAVAAGQAVSELAPGGAVVLPDGRTISDGIVPRQFFLAPQHRYLLFLRYTPNGRFFSLVKSWELKDHVLQPNSAEDREKSSQGTSRYSGKTEEDAISLLQARIKHN